MPNVPIASGAVFLCILSFFPFLFVILPKKKNRVLCLERAGLQN